MKNINKLTKEEKEALDKLSEKQVFLLMKKVTNEYLLNKEESEKRERMIKLRDYFFDKNVYSAYNSLNGMFNSIDNERIGLLFEKDSLIMTKELKLILDLGIEFSEYMILLDLAMNLLLDYIESENIPYALTGLIKCIYSHAFIYYSDGKPLLEIIKEKKDTIAKNHEDIKELLKENQEIKVNSSFIEELEFNFNLLVENIEEFEENYKKFEEIREDGFKILNKEIRSLIKSNIIYDFDTFSIKRKA